MGSLSPQPCSCPILVPLAPAQSWLASVQPRKDTQAESLEEKRRPSWGAGHQRRSDGGHTTVTISITATISLGRLNVVTTWLNSRKQGENLHGWGPSLPRLVPSTRVILSCGSWGFCIGAGVIEEALRGLVGNFYFPMSGKFSSQ